MKKSQVVMLERDIKIKKMVEEGKTSLEISEDLSVNFSTVNKSIKRQGLKSNKKRKEKFNEYNIK